MYEDCVAARKCYKLPEAPGVGATDKSAEIAYVTGSRLAVYPCNDLASASCLTDGCKATCVVESDNTGRAASRSAWAT